MALPQRKVSRQGHQILGLGVARPALQQATQLPAVDAIAAGPADTDTASVLALLHS
jgi:hypothetical protein